MYTSVLLVALMGPGAAPTQALEAPKWQESYAAALNIGQREGKPLAVFIGGGPTGWNSLVEDGKLSEEARRLLKEHYVCVYIDNTLQNGRQLATAFEVSSGSGLILSTRDCSNQAFWHKGQLSNQLLEARLLRHSNGYEVSHTESVRNDSASAVQTVNSPSTRTASYGSPASGYPGTFSGSPIGTSPVSPSFGGSYGFGQGSIAPASFGGGFGGGFGAVQGHCVG